jgi:hypothetical protein
MGSVLCRWGLNPQPTSRLAALLTLAKTNEQGTEAEHPSKIFRVVHCEPGLESLLNIPGIVIYSRLTEAHGRNLKTKFISNMKGLTPWARYSLRCSINFEPECSVQQPTLRQLNPLIYLHSLLTTVPETPRCWISSESICLHLSTHHIDSSSEQRCYCGSTTEKNVIVKVTLRLIVGQSVCLGVEPDMGLWPHIRSRLTVIALSLWGALSDERTGLPFVSSQLSESTIYLHFKCC